MTDAEWLACEDPHALLAAAADRGGERKLWLFIAGSLRLDWARLNGRLRRMVKVMERFADGRSRGQTLLRAMASAWRRDTSAADLRPGPMAYGSINASWSRSREVKQAQCELLRELYPPPSHPPAPDPAWLAANGGAATRLARAIHAEQRFEDLPVLADALEEAGCADESLLGHCRRSGGHARGCWALELLLGTG